MCWIRMHRVVRAALVYAVYVGSDNDGRNRMVLEFYARRRLESKQLVYLTHSHLRPGGTEWLVRHHGQRPATRERLLLDPLGNRYALEAEFDHGAISGFYWAVYRNENSTEPDEASARGRGPAPD